MASTLRLKPSVALFFFVALAVTALTGRTNSAGVRATPISEQETQAIGIEAYLCFYPLVTMDLTRRQMTTCRQARNWVLAPPNTFNNVPTYPSASDRVVVRPNYDTLYSSAWLDLSKEPMGISAPDTDLLHDIPARPKRTAGTRPPSCSERGNGPSSPTFPSASGGPSECASASPRISVPPSPTPQSNLGPKLSHLKNPRCRKKLPSLAQAEVAP
jgi:hypothetical protein